MRDILNRFLRAVGLRRSGAELVSVAVPEDRLREMLKGSRDIVIHTASDGMVSAFCKECGEWMEVVQKDSLVWFRCGSCRLVSFNPIPNVARDIQFAIEDGAPFVYEIYFVRNLPPEFPSPFKNPGQA